MGPFYAYAKITTDNTCWRYLITFASREIADEWWRMVSTPPSPCIGVFRRISPQYYTHTKHNLGDFFFKQKFPGGNEMFDKVFFTLLGDRDAKHASLIPSEDITDHISGNWFYIRFKSDPRRYWYFCVDGDSECLVCGKSNCDTVHVSIECRSRFRIQACDIANNNFWTKGELIMIGSDQVTIAPSKESTLQINDDKEVKATKAYKHNPSLFLFRDLQDRFSTRAERLGEKGTICESLVPVERGSGDVWELVA